MNEEIKTTGGQAAETTQPEVNGASTGGKTFTQEDVNKIVSERLAKERAKQEPQADPVAEQFAQRERDLVARENKMTCREYVKSRGLNENLMDIFDTSDSEAFQKKVDQLLELYPQINPIRYAKMPKFSAPTHGGSVIGASDPIAQAFRGK